MGKEMTRGAQQFVLLLVGLAVLECALVISACYILDVVFG